MKNMRMQLIAVMGLGIFSLIAGLFAHLALTDIYHGEADVSLDWLIVQIAAVIILVFIGCSLWTLARALKLVRK